MANCKNSILHFQLNFSRTRTTKISIIDDYMFMRSIVINKYKDFVVAQQVLRARFM